MICANIHSERIIVSGNLFAKRCVVLHVRHCDEFSSIWEIDAYALANVRIRFLMADRLRRVKMSFPSKHNNEILSCIVWMIGRAANSKNDLNSIHPFRFVLFRLSNPGECKNCMRTAWFELLISTTLLLVITARTGECESLFNLFRLLCKQTLLFVCVCCLPSKIH